MKVSIDSDVSKADEEVILQGLNDFNETYAGPTNLERFQLAVRSEDGEVVAGVLASCIWQWLHINVIWVSEELRGQGYGSKLLDAAEKEGIKRGRKYVVLHTFSFQARPFYERHGYKVSGELMDFPEGHAQFTMMKRLSPLNQRDV
jgi:ribosomal protein S18 acetylase RimI-like enzyme